MTQWCLYERRRLCLRKEPIRIVLSNLRRFERLIADPNTPAVTQTILTKLIAEERAKLAAAKDDAEELDRSRPASERQV